MDITELSVVSWYLSFYLRSKLREKTLYFSSTFNRFLHHISYTLFFLSYRTFSPHILSESDIVCEEKKHNKEKYKVERLRALYNTSEFSLLWKFSLREIERKSKEKTREEIIEEKFWSHFNIDIKHNRACVNTRHDKFFS